MNNKQKEILNLLWSFQSLKEEQIIKITKCEKKDIDYLIVNKLVSRIEKTNIIKHNIKEANLRNVIAFDIVIENLHRCTDIEKGKKPPTAVSFKVGNMKYEVIIIKEEEVEKLYNDIDNISDADKIYIIIETKRYLKQKINTKRECLISTYPPLQIVDKVN